MNITVVKLKTVTLIALMVWSISSFAQSEMVMYVMKKGEVIFQSSVSAVDNVIFDKASSDNALILQKNNDSLVDKILLNDIQQLAFSEENMSIKTSNDNKEYMFEDIMKLFFGNINITVINNRPAKSSFEVLVYVNTAGNMTIESPIFIKSLILFNIYGRTIFKKLFTDVEVQYIIPLQGIPAGVYLLRVETEQGIVVKKIVKP